MITTSRIISRTPEEREALEQAQQAAARETALAQLRSGVPITPIDPNDLSGKGPFDSFGNFFSTLRDSFTPGKSVTGDAIGNAASKIGDGFKSLYTDAKNGLDKTDNTVRIIAISVAVAAAVVGAVYLGLKLRR
jgi:hypothetical protein